MTRFLLVSASLALLATIASAQQTALKLPAGAAPQFDGKIGADEWTNALKVELRRTKNTEATGYVRRVGRQLYFAFRSEFNAIGIGFRINFRNPVTQVSVQVLVLPMSPPRPPIVLYRQPAERSPERFSAVTCDVRFDFPTKAAGFTMEMRIPLAALEIGREARQHTFSVELWDLISNRPLAVFPHEGDNAGGEALLEPVKDWGADVPVDTKPPADNEAIRLLEQVEVEQRGRADGGIEFRKTLFAHMGWRDGQRRDAPLAAVEARIRKAIEARPEYVSLRANLMWTLLGRGDHEAALAVQDAMGEDYPLLKSISRHVLIRSELLRGLGRFDEAATHLKQYDRFLREMPVARQELATLMALARAQKLEDKLRAEETTRDDLPRVRLKLRRADGEPRGEIVLELFEDDAPNAVANFVSLVEKGAYDGTRFHWVEGGRRVVGGDPNSKDDDPHNDGLGGPGYRIESEPSRRLNLPFTIVFADERGARRSEGSAFMLHIEPLTQLDGMNSVFGRVIEGHAVVRGIEYYDVIEKAEVIRKRGHEYVPVKR